jgi:hypothetical protein
MRMFLVTEYLQQEDLPFKQVTFDMMVDSCSNVSVACSEGAF